jgi:hypothetical protein
VIIKLMFNKNKKQLVLPIIVVSLAIGFLFHEDVTIGPLSSLSSASQILSTYNIEQKISSMSPSERDALMNKINAEKNNLFNAMQPSTMNNPLLVPTQTIMQREVFLQNQFFLPVNNISVYENRLSKLGGVANLIEEANKGTGVRGCTNRAFRNFNEKATINDGSCIGYVISGCTNMSAKNYNSMATKDDGTCVYKLIEPRTESCLCSGESTPKVEKPSQVLVNITTFGGPNDPYMSYNEPLAVGKIKLARNLDPNNVYTAWPMPGINEDTPNSLDIPNVEKCFGPEKNSWPAGSGDERVAAANKSLADYWAEISYTDPSGNKKTVQAEIVDRGPKDAGRWDASLGMWKALGLETIVNKDPKVDANKVALEVRLVPKKGTCTSYSN